MKNPNPLTLYVPIKQDAETQAKAFLAYQAFVPAVTDGLNKSGILHFANLSLVPNAKKDNPDGKTPYLALLLTTTFDGAMNPYLKFFWDNPSTQAAFAGLAALALNPPVPAVKDLIGFENFINSNNLSKPSDLYRGYTQTVAQIHAKFPPAETQHTDHK